MVELTASEERLFHRGYRAIDSLDTLDNNLNERKKAIKLYEELVQIPYAGHSAPSAKWTSKANELYKLLKEYFIPTVPPSGEEHLEQIREYVWGLKVISIKLVQGKTQTRMERNSDREVAAKDFDDERWMTSYHATFGIMMIRRALVRDKLPMTCANGWSDFAKVYAGLVMAA